MASPEIEAQRRALAKRGFRKDDAYFFDCAACNVKAVEKWVLLSKLGGRDVELCVACGVARSWSRRGLTADREEEPGFDLNAFLRR